MRDKMHELLPQYKQNANYSPDIANLMRVHCLGVPFLTPDTEDK